MAFSLVLFSCFLLSEAGELQGDMVDDGINMHDSWRGGGNTDRCVLDSA